MWWRGSCTGRRVSGIRRRKPAQLPLHQASPGPPPHLAMGRINPPVSRTSPRSRPCPPAPDSRPARPGGRGRSGLRRRPSGLSSRATSLSVRPASWSKRVIPNSFSCAASFGPTPLRRWRLSGGPLGPGMFGMGVDSRVSRRRRPGWRRRTRRGGRCLPARRTPRRRVPRKIQSATARPTTSTTTMRMRLFSATVHAWSVLLRIRRSLRAGAGPRGASRGRGR